MERQLSVGENWKRGSDIKFNLDDIAFVLLCCYTALVSLAYMRFIPTFLETFTLYGFLFVSFLSVIRKRTITLNAYVLSYAVFILWCFISVTYTKYFDTTFESSIEVLKVFLFILMLVNIVDSIKKIEIILFLNSFAPVFLIIYMAFTNQLFIGDRIGGELTGNINIFATLLMIASMCSIYFIFVSKDKKLKILGYICFFAEEFALFLTGSRKAAILPIVLFCAVVVVKADSKGHKHIIRNSVIATGMGIGILIAIMEIPFLYDAIGYRMEGLFNLLSGEGKADASSLVRADMIEEAISRWKEKPLIGHGIDAYKRLSHYGCYSHNNFVELLCDIGIIGFIIYYTSYILVAYKTLSRRNLGVPKWYWIFFLLCLCLFETGGVTYNMFPVHTFITLMYTYMQICYKNASEM